MAEVIKRGPDVASLIQYASPEFRSAYAMAAVMAASGQFKDVSDANKALARILLGGELGLAPAASLILIDFVQGKPRLSGAACAALIKRSKDYAYHIKTLTDTLCEIEFWTKKEDGTKHEKLGVSSFSAEDVKRAGLNSDPHKKFPKNMLFNRALTNGFRLYTPDLAGGVAGRIYAPGEIPGDSAVEADYDVLDGASTEEPKALPAPENVPAAKTLLGRVAQAAPAVAELIAERNTAANNAISSPAVKAEVALSETAKAAGIKPGDHPQLAPEPLTQAEVEEFPKEIHERLKGLSGGDKLNTEDVKTISYNARNSLGSHDKVVEQWKALDVVPKPGLAVPVRTALQFVRNVKAALAAETSK